MDLSQRRVLVRSLGLLLLAGCRAEQAHVADPAVSDDTAAADTAQPDSGTPDTSADTAPVDSASIDGDGDGSTAEEDCDDADPSRHPGAAEACDGVDHDCDGQFRCTELDAWAGFEAAWALEHLGFEADFDGDGFPELTVTQRTEYGDYGNWVFDLRGGVPPGVSDWSTLAGLSTGRYLNAYPLGDVDGDGLSDLSLAYWHGSGEWGDFYAATSLGSWGIWLSDGSLDGRELTQADADIWTGSEIGAPWWPSVGDITGDGVAEVTLIPPYTDDEGCGYGFAPPGKLADPDWTFADIPGVYLAECWDGVGHGEPVPLGDLDGDGLAEVRLRDGSEDYVVSGAELAAGRSPLSALGGLVASCGDAYATFIDAVGDVDLDGYADVSAACGTWVLVPGPEVAQSVMTTKPIVTLDFSAENSGYYSAEPAAADVDANGRVDLVVPYGRNSQQGTPMALFPDVSFGGVLELSDASGRVFESNDGPWLVYIGGRGSDLLQWRPDVTGDGVLDLFVLSATGHTGMLIFSGATLFPP